MATRTGQRPVPVDGYIAALAPPLRDEVEALRRVILAADARIGEEVKWNAPSFHVGEHFATMRLHGKVPLQLILHLGVRKAAIDRDAIVDPDGLLQWLGPDRACIAFRAPGEVAARAVALTAILRQWLPHVPGLRPE